MISLVIPRSFPTFRLLVRQVGILLLAILAVGGALLNGALNSISSVVIDRDLETVGTDIRKLTQDVKDSQAAAGTFDPSKIKTVEDVTAQRNALVNENKSHQAMIDYFEHFEDHCRSALAKDALAPGLVDKTIAKLKSEVHGDFILAQYNLLVKLTNDRIALLDYLEKNAAHWTNKDGKLTFDDDAGVNGCGSGSSCGQGRR